MTKFTIAAKHTRDDIEYTLNNNQIASLRIDIEHLISRNVSSFAMTDGWRYKIEVKDD